MEFKGNSSYWMGRSWNSRYSNRMEFKGETQTQCPPSQWVDIATEWNLKVIDTLSGIMTDFVDIATEWNLKMINVVPELFDTCRYSNRMEFKVIIHPLYDGSRIIRRYSNRMEFKVVRLITRKSR